MAPMKGSINSLMRFGHLLGGGFRHSSIGSGFFLGWKSDMHLRDDCMDLLLHVLGRSVGRSAQLWGSLRALAARNEGRNGCMAGD
jgi:hypothetical protein